MASLEDEDIARIARALREPQPAFHIPDDVWFALVLLLGGAGLLWWLLG